MQNHVFSGSALPWVAAGAAVILILAGIAGYYLWQLRKARQAQAQAIAEFQHSQQQEREEKRQQAINSVRVLAASLGTDQITWTEGAMRISVLLPQITQDAEVHKMCVSLLELAEKTQHIPILADWKALSKKQQSVFDKERQGYEKALLPQLQSAVEFLNGWQLIQMRSAQGVSVAEAQRQNTSLKQNDLAVRVGN